MRRFAAYAVFSVLLSPVAWGAERPAVSPILTSLRPTVAPNGATFEYQLLPFYHGNFDNLAEFEKWMDNLGASGWLSIFHFMTTLDPRDDLRLFMRPVGEVPFEVDYDIQKNEKAFSNNVRVWVKAFNRLGKRGKIVVARFTRGGKTYAVTETYTLDGKRQTWRFRDRFAGKRHEVGSSEFQLAVEKQAEDGFVPLTIGFTDQSAEADYHVVGIKETTPGREAEGVIEVELRFGEAKLSTTPKQWRKLIDKQAKKGYQLVEVELADNSGTNFIVTFARVKIGNRFTRRTCVVEPILLNNLDGMTRRLNARGAAGYEKIYETFAGSFDSFQFVLCRDR